MNNICQICVLCMILKYPARKFFVILFSECNINAYVEITPDLLNWFIYVTDHTGTTKICGLVTFTEEILNGKLHFLCSSFELIHLCDRLHWHYENVLILAHPTPQKMKFSITDFFSKCDQIRIWSHLLKKSLMENFVFCAVSIVHIRRFALKISV